MERIRKNKKRNRTRNILWLALLIVWSFWAGAYFHLGWVRDHSMSHLTGFIIGGIGVWVVFSGMGILIYRIAKKNGNRDPARPALFVLSFFTLVFMLIALVRYNDVQKDKFIEDLEYSFVDHYENKALENGIAIEDLNWELQSIYSSIHFDLRKHPQLEEFMSLKTGEAIFEEDSTISNLCINLIEMQEKLGYPAPPKLKELFE